MCETILNDDELNTQNTSSDEEASQDEDEDEDENGDEICEDLTSTEVYSNT